MEDTTPNALEDLTNDLNGFYTMHRLCSSSKFLSSYSNDILSLNNHILKLLATA